eukprot:TRINITY_DN15146_c0_g2_i1.p1 TRINITY_DN15146_c0_g2~~TRINITY_DN15146_c0_g2_i1.p1  ORF type:complete len:555 (+),score=200.89 TRINITY_DN15146_c0_g2_i1:105-1667(+)
MATAAFRRGPTPSLGRTEFHEKETISSRRQKLTQKQQAWIADFEDDPELYSMLGGDYFDLHGAPSERELSMLFHSLVTPDVPEQERHASTRQLVQLMYSRDPKISLFALQEIAARMEGNAVDPSHLTTAVKPMVKIITGAGEEDDVYWAVLHVLQRLCVDDRHAMVVGDLGGAPALLALIGAERGTASHETVNHTMVCNVLNALWLIACYEGNGDLASYDEMQGPIPAMLSLLGQLSSDSPAMGLSGLNPKHNPLRDIVDDGAVAAAPCGEGLDPILVVLLALERLSALKVYRGQITGGGGIEKCVPLLAHRGLRHRITALRIIHNLMVDNSLEFVVLGGVQKVVSLMVAPSEMERTAAVRLALHLYRVRGDLVSLAGDMVATGCLAVCCDLLCHGNADLARSGLSLLSLICQHGAEDYSFLLYEEERLIPGLCAVLRSDHLPSKQQATALAWYLTRVEAIHQRLINAGVVPILNNILRHATDSVLHHNTVGCLQRLECFDDLGHDYFATGPRGGLSIQW